MTTNRDNMIVFFDTVGRTIVGEKINETETQIEVKNPVIVHIVPNQQTGQIALQLFPAFFKEFQGDKSEDTVWHYWKSQITLSNKIALDFRLHSQYENMFSNVVTPDSITPPSNKQDDNVIKLFDE